jgi:hypothetical protein
MSGTIKGFQASGSFGFDEANVAGFKCGGRVKKTEKALVHSGEYVLPKGVKPTAEQKAKVKELQKKTKK